MASPFSLAGFDPEDPEVSAAMQAYADQAKLGGGLVHSPVVPLGLSPAAPTAVWSSAPPAAGATVSNPGPATQWRGVYDDPRQIAADAAAKTTQESPNLGFYFPGTSRESLADTADRELAPPPDQMMWSPKAKARGTVPASSVTTPQNAQRLVDTLAEVRQSAPGMWTGMKGWYIMDPAYRMMVEQRGPDEANREFQRLNAMAFFSPASNVNLEINRGTAGRMFSGMGLTPQYYDAGLTNEGMENMGYPLVTGHMFNRNMVRSQDEFLNGGMTPDAMRSALTSGDPKVPLYYQASLPPELGGQSTWAVPDSHYARGLGFADVRPWKAKRVQGPDGVYRASNKMMPNGESLKSPDYTPVAPWFRNSVAAPLGLQAVPAQAIQWGALAPRTGVDTPVGAPKLELFADRIDQIARSLGITKPADKLKLRDSILWGQNHAQLDTAGGPAFA